MDSFVCNIIYIHFAVSLWPQNAPKAFTHNILTMLFINTVTLADYEHFKANMLKETSLVDSELKCKSHVPVHYSKLNTFMQEDLCVYT